MWAEVDGHLHELPAPRAAARGRRAARRATRSRAGSSPAGLLQRLGKPLAAATAREVFALLAKATPGYAGLDYRAIGAPGRGARRRRAARLRGCRGGARLMAASVVTVDRNRSRASARSCTGHVDHAPELRAHACSCARPRRSSTPSRSAPVSGRYRGIHILTEREDGTPKCVACYMCATVCPAECIYIESGERPEKTIEKYPTRFEIDLLRCVYCGFCVDACPEEAIIMSRENDLVGTTRAELDHRPRPPDGPRQAGRSTAPAIGPTTTTCAGRCASRPSSA